MPEPALPEVRVNLNNLELAYILHAVWEPAKRGDAIARTLFTKIKAAIIQSGIAWDFGHPWEG